MKSYEDPRFRMAPHMGSLFHASPDKEKRTGECPMCKQITDLVLVPSMTRYVNKDGEFDEEKNRDFWACEQCGEEHIQQMESQWADYYGN